MFTLTQIQQAHSQVKSGADFPAYARQRGQLGVLYYETHVIDGHTDYYGAGGYQRTSPAQYADITIAKGSSIERFTLALKAHQEGRTSYRTFCGDCAKGGVEKWVVRLDSMTCTYCGSTGEALLTEQIPS